MKRLGIGIMAIRDGFGENDFGMSWHDSMENMEEQQPQYPILRQPPKQTQTIES